LPAKIVPTGVGVGLGVCLGRKTPKLQKISASA